MRLSVYDTTPIPARCHRLGHRPRPRMRERPAPPGPCVLCGSGDRSQWAVVRDNRTGSFAEAFVYLLCRCCGLVSLHPVPDLSESLSDHERGYGGVIATPGSQLEPLLEERRRLERRLKQVWHRIDGMPAVDRLPVEGKVLDVGAGTGGLVAELTQLGYDAVGLEPNPQAVEVALSRGIPVHEGTAEAAPFEESSFDTVILSQVVEHLVDPIGALASLRRLVRPGGRLIVMTPNIHGAPRRVFGTEWAHWHPPYHVHLFGGSQLRRAISQAGYRVEEVATLTPSFWLNMSVQLRGHKSQHTGWVLPPGAWQLPHAVRLLIAPLTRTLDVLGVGDCLVAISRRERGSDD
jgi:SAM-dependent methyltransferase